MTIGSARAVDTLSKLLEKHTGQTLSEARLWRIDTELGPVLRAHGLRSLDELVRGIDGGANAVLLDATLDALLNHESSFFRDPAFFNCLRDEVLPALRERRHDRTLRIWSAGCSTGQEAYSVAMMLANEPDVWAGWKVRILATDVSAPIIERARRGIFEQRDVQRGLAIGDLLRWFEARDGAWQISATLRSMIDFRQHNLADLAPPIGEFDVILCRNVLLYLPPPIKERACERFADAAREGCYLMLGAGETLTNTWSRFERCTEARLAYRLAEDEPSTRWRDDLRRAS